MATSVASGPPDSIDALLAEVARAPSMLTARTVIDETFQIERLIGAGGMGMVYLARDLRLGRPVALKMHTATGGSEQALREAKVMARLSHPNVVTVYQVGTYDRRLYIAMEYVEGGSLRAWLDERPRGWREILDVFVKAGQGLAAAHAAGLVHRDFKPDNVLCGVDGRVRVADFGLARTPADGDAPAGGTPRYMAPEQKGSGEVDARADQYSFAFALREALGAAGPRWLRRIVDRGAEEAPARRWPSMAALLDAIDAERRRRRRYALGIALVSSAGLVAIGAGWQARRGSAGLPPVCEGARAQLDGVWDAGRAAELERAVGDGATALREALDRYADGWVAGHRDACEATRVRGDQGEGALDLRMACLTRARGELDALVTAILTQPGAARDALSAAGRLPDVAGCAATDELVLVAPYPADPAARERLHAIERALDEVAALQNVGRFAEALPRAREQLALARAERYEPVLARALSLTGGIAMETGGDPEALTYLEDAVITAIRGGDDRAAIDATVQLAWYLAGASRGREAARWIALADALEHRSAHRTDDHLLTRLELLRTDDRHQEVERIAQQELAGGGDARRISALRNQLALAQIQRGDPTAALATLAEIDEAASDRRGVGAALRTRSIAHYLLGDLAAAEALARQVIAIGDELFGDLPAPFRGDALSNLAVILTARGAIDEAMQLSDQAIAIYRASDLHPRAVAAELGNVAIAQVSAGRIAEALHSARASLLAFEAIPDLDPVDLVNATQIVGTLERMDGDVAASERTLGRAVERAAALPAEQPERINAEVELALTELAAGRAAAARDRLEPAVAALERRADRPGNLAEARFALARALRASGGDRDRARALAIAARDAWAGLEGSAPLVEEVETWLARR